MKNFELLNAAYTQSTWKVHASALSLFRKFENTYRIKFEWPLNEETINKFCHWALKEKELKSKTVEAYISSIATIHKLNLLDDAACKNFICKTILRGAENMEIYKSSKSRLRLVMTLDTLKILGHEIAKTNWDTMNKQVVWAASCLAFFGSCRIGEILSPVIDNFDPKTTLLWGDMKNVNNGWIIHIKSPKSRIEGGEYLDIFDFKGHQCCPVKAIQQLQKMSQYSNSKENPVFMFKNGSLLTKNIFNEKVRNLLKGPLGEAGKNFSGHSFRAGIPSALAKYPELVSDNHIMGWGRWGSAAYISYTRLKNDQKRKIFGKISVVLNNSVL